MLGALNQQVDPATRGDPMSPLRWTCKSTRMLADELWGQGRSQQQCGRMWRWALQQFSNQAGLKIELCHSPPGTSKWNKVEHRLFCHVARNWQGIPLETHEIVVKLFTATRMETGLEVHAWLDETAYEKSKKVPEDALAWVRIRRNRFRALTIRVATARPDCDILS